MLNLIKSHVFTVHSIKCYLQDLQAAARLSLAETETTRQGLTSTLPRNTRTIVWNLQRAPCQLAMTCDHICRYIYDIIYIYIYTYSDISTYWLNQNLGPPQSHVLFNQQLLTYGIFVGAVCDLTLILAHIHMTDSETWGSPKAIGLLFLE